MVYILLPIGTDNIIIDDFVHATKPFNDTPSDLMKIYFHQIKTGGKKIEERNAMIRDQLSQ